MADAKHPKVTVEEMQKMLDKIDWDKFSRNVITENTKNAEAYEKARAKSLQSAAQYVLV